MESHVDVPWYRNMTPERIVERARNVSIETLLHDIGSSGLSPPHVLIAAALERDWSGPEAQRTLLKSFDHVRRPRYPQQFNTNPLWLAVLMGELRLEAAVQPLVHSLLHLEPDRGHYATVYVEALGRIGAPAWYLVRHLVSLSQPVHVRLWGNAILGLMDWPQAVDRLRDAWELDPDLADGVALAMSDRGDPSVVPLLVEGLDWVEGGRRVGLEAALRRLHGLPSTFEVLPRNWRIRYLPEGEDEVFTLGWPAVLAVWHTRPWLLATMDRPRRSLAEILGSGEEIHGPSREA